MSPDSPSKALFIPRSGLVLAGAEGATSASRGMGMPPPCAPVFAEEDGVVE